MAVNEVTFRTFEDAGRLVLAVTGELDMAWASRFEFAVAAAGEAVEDGGELVLDLTRVGFLDSSALQALMRASRTMNTAGVEWTVLTSDAVDMVLEAASVPPDIVPVVRPGSGARGSG